MEALRFSRGQTALDEEGLPLARCHRWEIEALENPLQLLRPRFSSQKLEGATSRRRVV